MGVTATTADQWQKCNGIHLLQTTIDSAYVNGYFTVNKSGFFQ